MMLDNFGKMIAEFKSCPVPGKHVFVWNDDKTQFVKLVGKNLIMELDVAAETELIESEVDEMSIRRKIEKTLQTKLSSLYEQARKEGKQQLLVVNSASIFARYGVGLTAFYDFYLGDRTMVVFIVPKPKNMDFLVFPEYVRYDPEVTLKYLANLAGFENVVEAK